MKSFEDAAIERAAYSTMSDQVIRLVTDIGKMATLQLDAFMVFYKQKGMLLGTGEPTEDELIASQALQRRSARRVNPGIMWESLSEGR